MTAASDGNGPRHLTCRRLDLWLRPDRTLQQAVAGPDADLTLMPGAERPARAQAPAARTCSTFVFDDKGKLEELTALKDTLFTTEAILTGQGRPADSQCKRFDWPRCDPATGRATHHRAFLKDVSFAHRGPQKRHLAARAHDGSKTTLTLTEDPVMTDEQQGTRAPRGDHRDEDRPRRRARARASATSCAGAPPCSAGLLGSRTIRR